MPYEELYADRPDSASRNRPESAIVNRGGPPSWAVSAGRAGAVAALQRSAGNTAVSRLLGGPRLVGRHGAPLQRSSVVSASTLNPNAEVELTTAEDESAPLVDRGSAARQSSPASSAVPVLERPTGTDSGHEQAVPVQEPEDESLELSESDPTSQPTSVMVGGEGGGGGAAGSGGGSGDLPRTLSPERQAELIVADSAQSEQQVKAVTAARRREMSAQFGAVRRRITGLLASSSAGIRTFLATAQTEVRATTSSVLTSGQAMLAGAIQAAQGQIQQARAVLEGVAQSATAALEGQVGQTAGRITGLVNRLSLPDLPGVSAIRAGAAAVAGRAASAVTAALGQVRGLVGTAVRWGAGQLGTLLASVSQRASSALSRIGSMIQGAVRSVFAGLSRVGAALLDGLRRAVRGTVLAGLGRAESKLQDNLATAERQAIASLHTNRDGHLQALRDGRGAADGSPNLAEQARQNNVAVITTFRERVTGLLGSIFDAISTGASALGEHLGQLVSRVIAIVRAPLAQILTGLRQAGQAISGFLQSVLTDLSAGITSVVGSARSLIQQPLDAAMHFASGAVSRAGQFFTSLPSRLLAGNLRLPSIAELIGDARAAGPIVKPPPGTIVKPILTFLAALFLTIGILVVVYAPSLAVAVAAVLAFLGITVAPATFVIIVGVVAVLALIAALLLLYLLYRLVKPGLKPPPPVITHQTDFSAPDGSPKSRGDVGVGERVVFTGSAAGTWTASAGSPRSGTGPTFAWVAPERRRTVTIRLTVGRGKASAKLSVLEPNGIVAHKLSDQKPAAGKFGAGMFLDFEFHPLRVSFGNAASREVEGPASAIEGYYKRFSKKFLRHNPGPVHFFPIGQNNRWAPTQDDASWLDQPPPFKDGSFHWKIPNKFRVVTESGDGKKYTTVIQEFGMEASGRATVDKAGAHTQHP